MPTAIRIFETKPATQENPRPQPTELEMQEVLGTDDAAKANARVLLEARNYSVRSLSWGPMAGRTAPVLVAYVEPKGA